MYRYYQPNKKDIKDNYRDCVIRALTMLLDKSWLDVFDELVPYARELQDDFSCGRVYGKYLIDNGFTYVGISNKRGSKRPTVSQFAQDHKKGKYFCNLAHHAVCIVDGVYYDTWDCGGNCLYGYYEEVQKTSDDNSRRNSSDYTEAICELYSNIVNKLINSQ